MPSVWALLALGAMTAFFGSIGGVGGGTILVPALLALGVDPLAAAPLGIVTVAATSLAASVRQLDGGLVHHRLGLTVESTASVGAVAGALVSTSLPQVWLARALGLGALAGGIAMLARRGQRNLPDASFTDDTPGEWPGSLGGTYTHEGRAVPYHASRVPQGLAVSLVAGLVAGMSGVGGGFIKTPAMSEVMRVPVKVAAATSTFTLGIGAAATLLVFGGQGRVELRPSAGVVLGAVCGAVLGAATQNRLPPRASRVATGALLLTMAAIVLVRAGWGAG